VLVEAPGGYGKSALMAQLVDRVRDGRWPGPEPALACFFIRADGARNTAVAFLQALNAQLLDELGLPGGTPPGVTELQGQLSELWAQARERATPARPVLVVVDGLDEMADEEVTIADVLPSALGDHVHVVASSRVEPDARETVAREHPLRSAQTLAMEAFGLESIRLLIARYELDQVATSAERILAMTSGEPLFARFVCEAIAEHGPGELERLERAPPKDAEDYFREQLRRLAEAELGDVSWRVLGALVVAHGGMTEDELAELLEQPRRTMRGALRPVRRFLLGDGQLEIFHRSLTELVAGEFTAAELAQLRERFVAWCRGYQDRGWPPETPRYIVEQCAQHYAEHDPASAVALIDQAWLERQRETVGAAAGFIRDLTLALTAAAGDASSEVRLCLAGANAAASASAVPAQALRVLAQCGAADEARARAGLAGREEHRAEALAAVARGVAAAESAEQARPILAAAVEELAAEYWKFDEFVPIFGRVVERAAGDGALLRRLLEVAQSMDWAKEQATCLGTVGTALRAGGDAGAVQQAIRDAADAAQAGDELRGDVLAALAVTAGSAGARDLLDELTGRARTTKERAGVAEGWARQGDPARATELVESIEATHIRALSEGEGAGELGAALRLLEHPDLRAIRTRLAERFAALYDGSGIVDRLPDDDDLRTLGAVGQSAALARVEARLDDEHNDSYGPLAEAYAAAGDDAAALRCFKRMEPGDGSMLDASVVPAAALLAGAGHLDGARAVADLGWYPSARAKALSFVAAALLDAGDDSAALDLARHAIRVAESLDDDGAGAGAYGALASALIDAGDRVRAEACAEHGRAALERVLPGARTPRHSEPVIDGLVHCGRRDEALALADGEYPQWGKIAEIAGAYAAGGDTARALALAERVFDAAPGAFLSRERVEMLFTAATAFRLAGRPERADDCVALAEATDDEEYQWHGEALVRGLRDAGRPEDAAALAREFAGRSDAWPELGPRLFDAAGLRSEAAAPARAALALPAEPDDSETGWWPAMRKPELARLLPAAEAVTTLQALRTDAATIADPYLRAEELCSVAAALHELDPALAGATLREAFLAGWVDGRRAFMLMIARGPLADLDPALPAQLADQIPEIDSWWAE
jgi:hypothetical protein